MLYFAASPTSQHKNFGGCGPRDILGKLTLFAGDPGLGKSFVTLDIAAHVTRGKNWPDSEKGSGEPSSVIVLSAEDDPADTIRPRLEAGGADLSKVHILQAVRRDKPNGGSKLEPFSLENDLLSLQDAVVSLGDVRLVVIDPISAYLHRFSRQREGKKLTQPTG